MPARPYMVVDRRHDHSLRIPRPDLSAQLGTPNACNDCHTGKSADSAAAVERWHGPGRKGFQHYADSLVRHPSNHDTLLALISFSCDAGEFGTALEYAERLARGMPNDPRLRALIESLQRQLQKPDTR